MLPGERNLIISRKSIPFFLMYSKSMHKEILVDRQLELLPLVKQFKKEFLISQAIDII